MHSEGEMPRRFTSSVLGTSLDDPKLPMTEVDVDKAVKIVQNAQRQLKEFATAETNFSRDRIKEKLGQNEGLCTLLKLASIDRNADGMLDSDELAKFCVIGRELIATYIDSFRAGGVVTALVLSVVFNLMWVTEVPNGASTLHWIELILLAMVVSCCFVGLFMSGMMYIHIQYCIPTEIMKVEYCIEKKKQLAFIEAIKSMSYILASLSLFVHIRRVSGTVAGFITLLPFFGMMMVLIWHVKYINSLDLELQAHAKQLLGITKKDHELCP